MDTPKLQILIIGPVKSGKSKAAAAIVRALAGYGARVEHHDDSSLLQSERALFRGRLADVEIDVTVVTTNTSLRAKDIT